MKYAIIENEAQSLEHLTKLIEDLRPDWNLVWSSATVKDTLENLKNLEKPGLIFMDIELDDGNSFEIFERIRIDVPIIFTTAYDKFCLQAFKVNSCDYVLKPIATDEILFAIRKFEGRKQDSVNEDKYKELINITLKHKSTPRILISKKDSYDFVLLSDVAWFENDDKCVFLITHDGDRYITTFATLNEVEEISSEDSFFRISRSVLVNIDSIVDVKKAFNYKLSVVCEAGKKKLNMQVSYARKKAFLKWFGQG